MWILIGVQALVGARRGFGSAAGRLATLTSRRGQTDEPSGHAPGH
ncbi:hypothetical protein AB0937_13065 [Streptomyces sp. NPDC047880]